MSRNTGGSSQQTAGPVTAPAGPVTNATVGTQGSQGGAGTDQELGNLSVMNQSGFAQIAQMEQSNSALLTTLANGMNGNGTTMQQFGSSIQNAQNGAAASNAVSGTTGQNAGNNPSTMSTGG